MYGKRQTKYTKLMHNELWLQMMQTLAGTVDPAIMLEGLEYDEKETMLENIRQAQQGGITALQRENEQLKQVLAQMQQQMKDYQAVADQAQSVISQDRASKILGLLYSKSR